MPAYYLIPKKLVNRLPSLQKAAWWFEAAVIGGMVKFIQALGQDRGTQLLARLFAAIGPFTGKAAKVRKNLAFVLPDENEKQRHRLERKIFANLGRATAELAFMDNIWQARNSQMEFVAAPGAEAVLRSQKPAVMVTAHVGAWQLTNLVGAHYGVAITTVYAPETNPHLAELFYRLRSAFRTRLVPSEGGVRQLLRELQQGHSVGLAVDTRLDSGELVPFFGVPAPTNTVPARLALSARCPLMVARAERLAGGRYRITMFPPIVAAQEAKTKEEKALSMTAQLNGLFEQWIREDPSQWMCLKRRWPKDAKPHTGKLP